MRRNVAEQNQRRRYAEPQVAQQVRKQPFIAPTPSGPPMGQLRRSGQDLEMQQRREQLLPPRSELVEQAAMIAPVQDPFNDQSMTLPRGTTRPTIRAPRGEYRAVQPPRQISVLSSEPVEEPNDSPLTNALPEPASESFSESSPENSLPREGVNPPPVHDQIPFGSASPLRGPQPLNAPEELPTTADTYPLELVLEDADSEESQDAQQANDLLDRLEREMQPAQEPFGRQDAMINNRMQDTSPSKLMTKSCDEFRESLLSGSIRDIALDISPPASSNRDQFVPISRSWTDRNGNVVANGSMVDLRRGYVIIEGAEGLQKIPYAKLSGADWAAVAEYWQIPVPCGVGIHGEATRNWTPQTYTWKASALCHKPLYFEDVQLERYGHSHGPISQPVRSVAHFFVSFVTWPYQTAIHPSNECQYALGYYRPGDCAPWLKDPIPFSLSGLGRQALVTGAVIAIP
jgi:hypothetical protein